MDVRGGPWSNLRLVAGPSFLRPRIGASPRASRTRLYASGATQTVLDALKESVEATLWLWGWPLCLWYPLMLMLMDTFKKMLIFQLGRSSMESLRNHLNYLAWTIRNAPRRRSVQLSAKWQGQPYAVLDLVRMEVLGYKLAFQGWASWCFWAGRRRSLVESGTVCWADAVRLATHAAFFCIEDRGRALRAWICGSVPRVYYWNKINVKWKGLFSLLSIYICRSQHSWAPSPCLPRWK